MSSYHGDGFVVVAEKSDATNDWFAIYDNDGMLPDEIVWFDLENGSINFNPKSGEPPWRAPPPPILSRKVPYQRYFGTTPKKDQAAPEVLNMLGQAMRSNASFEENESSIPVAYTYFGQFVFHDLTAMNFSSNGHKPYNERSACLDLDTVFGSSNRSHRKPATLMPVGYTGPPGQTRPCDLPRTVEGRASIVDLRSDDNLPLAQTHVALIRFFNAIVERFDGISQSAARALAVSHFQSVVLHDYLQRVIHPEIYRDVMENGRAIIHTADSQIARGTKQFRYMVPLEFAAACARFGHSMIRNNYPAWNSHNSARLSSFWRNTHNSCIPPFDGVDEPRNQLSGRWVSQWGKLLHGEGLVDGQHPLMAAKIDTVLAEPLMSIPDVALPRSVARGKNSSRNLASLSLMRGGSLQLSGAESVGAQVIHQLGVLRRPTFSILENKMLLQDEPAEVQRLLERYFGGRTPLWFYTLKEAAILGCGESLGPLASRIVMETIHAAIEESSPSILLDDWIPEPKLGPSDERRYTLSDLIAYAGLL